MDSETVSTEETVIEIEGVLEMIPHRYPFLMIDRVTDIVSAVSAIGHKNVTINEPHFQGHFPSKPVMPGVLIIEAMAQTSAVLVVHTLGDDAEGKLVYFMSVENAKFRRPVLPGDVLQIQVKTKQHRKAVWKFDGVAIVDGQVVADATFTAMIMDHE
jgi:3-hydroxyacyl-[acyl-carrier-protein] dehydratase